MGEWYYDFEENPYKLRPEPILLPDERIIWNRDDLDDKENLENFIKAVLEGQSVGLRIWGDSGAGKTWLVRYIKKRLESEIENPIIFYNRIVGAKSTFPEFYFDFITIIQPQLEKLLSAVTQKIGMEIAHWKDYWENPNLAIALHHINSKSTHEGVSREWLKGAVSATALKGTEIVTTLGADYQKLEVLEKLLHNSAELFSTCILVLDELARVKSGFGRELGREIKDIFDGFYGKFGLICTYTGSTSDALVDYYDTHFYERFEYDVGLKLIKRDYVPTFLRLHHQSYRKKDAKIKDQLYPFTKDAILGLVDLINPVKLVPRSILKSCGGLVLGAQKTGARIIDEKFVDDNARLIPPDVRVQT